MINSNIMIIGGFGGAGKTTAMIAVAKYFIGEGEKVGLIIRDQEISRVDSEYLKFRGLDVLSSNQIDTDPSNMQQYNYVLVEPCSTSTNIERDFIDNFQGNKSEKLNLLPLSILIDPLRLINEVILKEKHLPKEIESLIIRQLKEADILVVNKMDILSKSEIKQIGMFLQEKYPKKKIIYISAKTKEGIDTWMNEITNWSVHSVYQIDHQTMEDTHPPMKLSMVPGRVNFNGDIILKEKISGNYLISRIADNIKDRLSEEDHEIIHLKIYLKNGYSMCMLNCTSIYEENSIDKKTAVPIDHGNLLISIEAILESERLHKMVLAALAEVFQEVQGNRFIDLTSDRQKIHL